MIHGTVVPWPLSEGLRTWCGLGFSDGRLGKDSIAAIPEVINCPVCIRHMRDAKRNLDEWVPRLVSMSSASNLKGR